MIRPVVRMIAPFFMGLITADAASAGQCPERFSFVELGHIEADGNINPGGSTFRVERDGQSLLAKPPSCHDFSDEAAPLVDENGDPIPLVSTVAYSPNHIQTDVDGFSVTRVKVEATSLAVLTEQTRAAVRDDPTIEKSVGTGFICYSRAFAIYPSLVCDVDNPFDRMQPVYVSCENGNCNITGIAMSKDLIASANWNGDYASPMAVGTTAVEVVSDIYLFLIDQMAE